MKTKKPSLPIQIKSTRRAIATLETPQEAIELKTYIETIIKLAEKKGIYEAAYEASELWIEADRKLYKFLTKPSYPGVSDQTLAESLKISKSFLQKLRNSLKRAYEKPDNEIQDLKNKAYNKKVYLTRDWFIKSGQSSMFSKNQEWYTPPWIYERARLIMGSIDLDPATSKEAIALGNTAKSYFTKSDDALKQDWGVQKNIFCNPPYTLDDNSSGAKAFLNKLMSSQYKQAVFVSIEDSGTKYGQFLWGLCTAIFIPRGRVDFSGQKGNTRSSIVWGIGVDALKFYLAFKNHGHIETRYKTESKLRLELQNRQTEILPWIEKLKALPLPLDRSVKPRTGHPQRQNIPDLAVN